MEVISLIISSLALLAAAANLILFFWERKRDSRRHETMLEYIDTGDDLSIGAAKKLTRESLGEQQNCFDEMFDVFDKRLSDLEHGICPDYDAAVAVKESVDRFSEGVMNILTYGNPVPTQEKKKKGEEDKE